MKLSLPFDQIIICSAFICVSCTEVCRIGFCVRCYSCSQFAMKEFKLISANLHLSIFIYSLLVILPDAHHGRGCFHALMHIFRLRILRLHSVTFAAALNFTADASFNINIFSIKIGNLYYSNSNHPNMYCCVANRHQYHLTRLVIIYIEQ